MSHLASTCGRGFPAGPVCDWATSAVLGGGTRLGGPTGWEPVVVSLFRSWRCGYSLCPPPSPAGASPLVLWWVGPCSGSCKELQGGGLEIGLSHLWPCSPHKSDVRIPRDRVCAGRCAVSCRAGCGPFPRRLLALGARVGLGAGAPGGGRPAGAPGGRASGVLSISLPRVHLPQNFCGWPVVELVSNGLARTDFSNCSSKRKIKKFNFQRGIFPVILNKFHLFVLGMELGITSLAQMQIQSRKRNVDSDCSHVTMSHAIRCPGCRQRKM